MENVIRVLAIAIGKERYAKVIVCLILIAFGISSSEIHKKFGTSLSALRKYKSALETGKIEGVLEFKAERTKSKLDGYETLILTDFEENAPKTLREAQTRIEKLTGEKRSLNRIRVWLKKRGYVHGQ